LIAFLPERFSRHNPLRLQVFLRAVFEIDPQISTVPENKELVILAIAQLKGAV
jgi:hypothetical protein